MARDVFRDVAALGAGRRGYSTRLHQRVHDLVLEWLDRPEGAQLPFADSDEAFAAQTQSCSAWVQAEYRAAIEGVREARRLGATALELRMDSELVVRQLVGRYRVKNPGLLPLFETLVAELQLAGPVTINHVPRARNARADALANAALDARSKAPG